MKAITINLASRPFRNNRVIGSVLATAAAAIILATVYNLYVFLNYGSSYAEVTRTERESRGRLATLEMDERKLSKEIAARDFRRVYERGKFANDLILRRSFSWTLLFNKLEAVVPREVMMTSIRPNIGADRIVVHLQGVAKNHGALIALEEALQGNAVFANVYPTNERRLNPNRPEIAFALKFDYLPRKAAQPAAVVASAPASAPGTTVTRPAAPPAAAAMPAGEKKSGQETVVATQAERPGGVPAAGTVGRNGLPRTPEILARTVAAPGGAYVPPPAPVEEPSRGKGSKGKSRAGSSAQTRASEQGTALPVAQVAAGPATPAAEPKQDPPAVRPDVPLTFASRPVGEAYDELGRAYGVRFLIDTGVDRQAKVTADLGGKGLAEAIAALAGAAGHRVTRQQDGRYRVVMDGGAPIVDKPVREENLQSAEPRP